MIFTHPTGIFPESDIQHSMQLVLNPPMAAFGLQDALGLDSQNGDEIAGFDSEFVTHPLDVACADIFLQAERQALEASLGLWGSTTLVQPTNTPLPPLTGGGQNCHPAYPDVCIPPAPPDLSCPDIPYRNFRVLLPDPHNFDNDRNGIGCEKK